ncbi:circadian clock KaiB family protein [Thiococcus pfennigii]|uniref:circadian clock KaiB family protein n=1 Tax=Thiococcus pfennigii TaxID=1057 RepID=UPI001904043C|nr:circadian clock KaiB family protein [Thiococcus pfennigii]MBK1699795.1 hypothetical protein [Thiococcus pfennigii]
MSPYQLRLFVSGPNPLCRKAERAIRELLIERGVAYELDVIDVLADPDAAEEYALVATPTLECTAPPPVRRVVGYYEHYAEVFDALGIGDG